MKRTLLTVALALAAIPSFAAIQYEYVQKSLSEDDASSGGDLTAKAVVDGSKSRVDFLSGNLYPPGTYVVTNDGSHLFFVDPTKKWYTEFNAAGAVSAIGINRISIENLRSDVKQLPDKKVIAGVETAHYQLTIDYDVTLVMRNIPLKQRVHTVIDSWTTGRFGDLERHALANAVRTGNVDVDRLLELETTKIPGFPMKQTMKIQTTVAQRPAQTQLGINPTRTIVHEMYITSLRETQVLPNTFKIPAGYQRADMPEMPRTAADVLTFDPPSK